MTQTNTVNGSPTSEVLIGGQFIELGISPIGTFGSHNTAAPSTFGFSGTVSRNIIGMDTNVANAGGLVVGSNTGDFDYFMPGSPYVSWGCGYQIGSTSYAANAINAGSGYTAGTGLVAGGVTDTTPSGSTTDTSATALATFNNNLQVQQDIHLGVSDKFFTILVTLKNVGTTTLNHVRYTWNVDPDNTVDIGGSYTTVNTILNTSAADGYSVVQAASTGGTTSANIFLIAPDPRAKGFVNIGFGGGYQLYNSALYDTNTYTDGNTFTSDTGIGQTWDVGTLTAGQTAQFTLYISLSNMSVSSVLATIPPTISAGTVDPTTGNVSITPVFYSGTGTITDGSGTVLVANAVSGHTYTFNPTTTTVYNVNVTSGGVTTTSSTTVTISAPPPPPAPVASGLILTPIEVTAGGIITLTPNFSNGTGVITPNIGTVVSGNTYNAIPLTTTNYVLTVTSSNNATATTNNTVTVDPVPTAALTASTNTFTVGSLVTLTPNFSGGTGVITPNVGTVTSGVGVRVAPTATTNYTLTVTNPLGVTATANQTLSLVAQLATVALSNTTQTYNGSPLNPTVTTSPAGLSTALTYYPGGTAPTVPGTYSVVAQITDPLYYGAVGGQLTILAAPQVISIATPPPVTVGVPVTLNSTSPSGGAITYTVISGNATVNNGIITLSDTNPVVIQATQNGTSNYTASTQNITLTGIAYPTANLTSNAGYITLNSSATLLPIFANGTGNIDNSIGAVTTNNGIVVTPTTNTTYTLTVTDAGGVTANAAVTVNVVPAPSLTPLALTTNAITLGQQVTFTPNFNGGTATITPNIGAVVSGNSYSITPAGNTTYTLTVTNPAGTTTTQTIPVYVYATPTANALVTGNTNLTLGQSVTFTPVFANGIATITPNIGAVVSGNSYTDTPSANTTYTLTVTNPAGSTVTQNAVVNVYAAPVTSGGTAVSSTTIAAGSSVTITPNFTGGTATLTGVTGNVVSGQSYTLYPTTSGAIVLTVTNPAGAVTTQSFNVNIIPNPSIGGLTLTPSTLPYGGGVITLTPTFSNGTGIITPNVGTVTSGTSYTANVTANTTYTLTVTNTVGVTATTTTNSVAVSGVTTRLVNISALGSITPTNTYTVGFVVKGTEPKNVLVRGVGPALSAFNVATPLTAPTLTLYDVNSNILGINSGWNSPLASTFAKVGAFALPANSKDAALMTAFNPGQYTAIVTGNTSGTALVEIYDASASDPTSRIINLSARGMLASGNTLTAGFIIQGNTTETVLIRAVGPSLANYSVPGVLATPKLTVYNSAGTAIVTNSGWANNATLSSTAATVGAFPLTAGSADCAAVLTLQPGAYTATVTGLNGNSGNVLLEVYEVSAP